MATPTGRIKIEGDAEEFKRAMKDVGSSAKQAEEAVGESFVTIANNSLALVERIGGYISGLKNHIVDQMKLAADVERGDVAWRMLQRQNKELFDAAQNSFEYSVGLLKVRDSVFVINDLLGKGFNMTKSLYQELVQNASITAIRLNQPIQNMITMISDMGVKMEANSEEMKKLGVQIDKEDVFNRYALSINKAVTSLTEAEKKTAFLSELLSQLSGKASVSFDEVSIMTNITQAYETYIDYTTDLNEKYAAKISQIGVQINKFFDDEVKTRQLYATEQRKILEEMGGDYKSWAEFAEDSLEQGSHSAEVFSDRFVVAEKRVEEAVAQAKKEMKDSAEMKLHQAALNDITAEYNQGIITLDQYAIRIEEMQKLMGLGEEGTESWTDKIRALNDAQLKEREEMYGAMEMQNLMFSKSSGVISDFSNKGKKDIASVKKEIVDLTSAVEAYRKVFDDVAIKERQDWLNKLEMFNDEIEFELEIKDMKKQIYGEILQARKTMSIEEAQTFQQVQIAQQQDIERFRIYAEERKLSEQDLALGIEEIKRRSAEKQAQIEQQSVTMQQRIREMGNNLYVASMNKTYEIVTKGQITSFQELLPFIMQQAGSMLWVEGTKNIGISLGLTANPFTAWAGPELFAAGLAQIALGGALGYAGNAMSSSSTSSSGAAIENRQAEIDYGVDQRTEVYLFPSEKEYLSNLKKSMKKIGA